MSRPPPQPPIPNGAPRQPQTRGEKRRLPPNGHQPQQGGITLGRSPGPLSPPISYGHLPAWKGCVSRAPLPLV